MVKYVCNNCYKEYHHKGNYKRHINRKNKCKKIENNGNIGGDLEKIKLTERSIERSIFYKTNENRTKIERKSNENYKNAEPKSKKSIKKNISPIENYDLSYNNYTESATRDELSETYDLLDNDIENLYESEENIPKLECTFQKWNKYSKNGMQEKNAQKSNENRTKSNEKYSKNGIFILKDKQNYFKNKENNNIDNSTSEINDGYEYKCKHCKKTFNKRYNLNKHTKRCKNKKLQIEDKETEMLKQMLKIKDIELEKQTLELEDAKKKIKELSKKTNNIIYNTVNNITLIAYNKQPDLSHLTNNDYLKIMNRGFNSVPYLIKAIHFNPKKPENQNVYIPNIKSNYVMVWNGIKWDLTNRSDILDDMYEDSSNILIEKMEELKSAKLKPTVLKKFKRFIDKKEEDEIKNKIKEDIKLLLYNNKGIIKK
jgi:hypothetical protein